MLTKFVHNFIPFFRNFFTNGKKSIGKNLILIHLIIETHVQGQAFNSVTSPSEFNLKCWSEKARTLQFLLSTGHVHVVSYIWDQGEILNHPFFVLTNTHTFEHSLSISHTHTLKRWNTHARTRIHTLKHTCTHSRVDTHTETHTRTRTDLTFWNHSWYSLSLVLATFLLTLISLSLSLSLSLSHTCTHTYT